MKIEICRTYLWGFKKSFLHIHRHWNKKGFYIVLSILGFQIWFYSQKYYNFIKEESEEMNYRLLNNGELIKQTDEVYDIKNERWIKYKTDAMVGVKYNEKNHNPIRRKVEGSIILKKSRMSGLDFGFVL